MSPRCKTLLFVLATITLFVSSETLADITTHTDRPIGERIAYWAETFIGTPYDTDPLGKYVREEKIVADDAVDCMYLTFRAVELALSKTPQEAIEKALDLRFIGKGRIDGERVVNYADRFEYGEDMIDSGKWGKEITSELGRTLSIKGSRGRDKVIIISKDDFLKISRGGVTPPLQNGDIVFFVKAPEKRVVGEIVGHIGIIAVKEGTPYLIHASGTKKSAASDGGGSVKSVPLADYIEKMKFIGTRIARFQ